MRNRIILISLLIMIATIFTGNIDKIAKTDIINPPNTIKQTGESISLPVLNEAPYPPPPEIIPTQNPYPYPLPVVPSTPCPTPVCEWHYNSLGEREGTCYQTCFESP
jgi:hypothetical protein